MCTERNYLVLINLFYYIVKVFLLLCYVNTSLNSVQYKGVSMNTLVQSGDYVTSYKKQKQIKNGKICDVYITII